MRFGEERGPLPIRQKFDERDLPKEQDRLIGQHPDNADRDRHRRECSDQEQKFDSLFFPLMPHARNPRRFGNLLHDASFEHIDIHWRHLLERSLAAQQVLDLYADGRHALKGGADLAAAKV